MVETEGKELIIASSRGITPAQEVEYAHEAAQVLMDVVRKCGLSERLSGDKDHILFEGWATVAKFYGCTIKANDVKPIGSPDKDGRYPGFTAKAVVLDKEGVERGGAMAGCMRDEKNWKTKDNFQLMSMAQTRAGAKAARMVFSWVVVLAGFSPTPIEEMEGTEEVDKPPQSSGSSEGSAKATKKATDPQRRMIWAKLKGCTDDEEVAKAMCKEASGKESSKDWMMNDIDLIVAYIDKYKAVQEQKEIDNEVPF